MSPGPAIIDVMTSPAPKRSSVRRSSPGRRVNTSLRLRATTLHELKLIAAHKGFSIQAMLERLVERYVEKKRVKILGKDHAVPEAMPAKPKTKTKTTTKKAQSGS
jgi:hypothetical protein